MMPACERCLELDAHAGLCPGAAGDGLPSGATPPCFVPIPPGQGDEAGGTLCALCASAVNSDPPPEADACAT